MRQAETLSPAIQTLIRARARALGKRPLDARACDRSDYESALREAALRALRRSSDPQYLRGAVEREAKLLRRMQHRASQRAGILNELGTAPPPPCETDRLEARDVLRRVLTRLPEEDQALLLDRGPPIDSLQQERDRLRRARARARAVAGELGERRRS